MNSKNVRGEGLVELTEEEMALVSGGMKWEGYPESDNVEDVRGCTPMDIFINPGSGHAHDCTNPRFRN